MPNDPVSRPNPDHQCSHGWHGYWLKRHMHWGGIFGGAFLAMAIQELLGMLGTGIGVSTINPLQPGATPTISSMALGAGAWWIISGIIALFIGGWVAGRYSGCARWLNGAVHGLIAWALMALVGLYLLGSALSSAVGVAGNVAGSTVSAAGSVVGSTVSAAGHGMAAAAPKLADQLAPAGGNWMDIHRQADSLLSQKASPKTAPTITNPEFDSLLARLLRGGPGQASQTDRTAVINALMARTGMSQQEAAGKVQDWETAYQKTTAKVAQAAQEAKQKALEAANATTSAIARFALWSFFALLLGGIAAAIGGFAGTTCCPHEDYTDDERGSVDVTRTRR